MLDLYKSKQKNWAKIKQTDYDFLIQLATSALGGKSGGSDDEVGMDDGEGLEYMDEASFNNLKAMLGAEGFKTQYGEWEDIA